MTRNLLIQLLSLMIFLMSCSTVTSDRKREGDNTGQEAALTVEEEKKLTAEAMNEMSKEFPPARNPELQAYISKLGQKIVNANNLGGRPYNYDFTVVDSDQVNAFAMPAGKIFMTIPIIAMADSEAEIAGVLGHEIGHVVARHTAERMYVAKKEQGKTWILGGIGAALGGAAGYYLGSKLCNPGDTGCKAKMTVYGLGGGAAGGVMIQKFGFMANSREDELESDRVGFRYAVKAGYDKDKVGDFYEKLLALEQKAKAQQGNALMGWLSDAMSSHPPSQERVKQAQEMKGLISSEGGISSTTEFQSMRKIARDIMSQYKKKP